MVRHVAACDLKDVAAFDTAQWSQFFFPEPSRARVLPALLRAMKPGGYVYMPVLPGVAPDIAGQRGALARLAVRALSSGLALSLPFISELLGNTPAHRRREKRKAALAHLLFHQWGIPIRSWAELRQEMEGAGFQVLRAIPTPASEAVVTRGLLLTQKPVPGPSPV